MQQSWCDALFMAPPAMALVAEATGELRWDRLSNALTPHEAKP
jgi:rhamnogalacturonyl hydrolase YesR